MTNNETIVNGNTTNNKIIEEPHFVAVDLDVQKNTVTKDFLGFDKCLNYLIDNDWVIYSNDYEYVKKPIIIRNGIKIIEFIWRRFSIMRPSGYFGTPYNLQNYIRLKHGRGVDLRGNPASNLDTLHNKQEYEEFIDLAYSFSEFWVANSFFRELWGLSFRSIPYFTQCFSSIQDFWVVKNGGVKFIDWASVFYYLYIRDAYGERAADSGIAKLKEIREVYYDKK